MVNYYICTYADYTDLPLTLFHGHTPHTEERVSLDGLKFVARCGVDTPGSGCLSWMNGDETPLTHSGVLEIVNGPAWVVAE